MLLGAKVSKEIAATRGVPAGQDCLSPSRHSAFSTPEELLDFAATLRQASGGKPVGIKLCVGQPEEIAGIVKAMYETGKLLDFITVDGSEGGTGAAPAEFCKIVFFFFFCFFFGFFLSYFFEKQIMLDCQSSMD